MAISSFNIDAVIKSVIERQEHPAGESEPTPLSFHRDAFAMTTRYCWTCNKSDMVSGPKEGIYHCQRCNLRFNGGNRPPDGISGVGVPGYDVTTMATAATGFRSFSITSVPMWRWEKYDFEKRQVHVSCPQCFSLTRAPIDEVMKTIQCSQTACTFEGYVAFDHAAQKMYIDWKGGGAKAPAGLGAGPEVSFHQDYSKAPPPLDAAVEQELKDAFFNVRPKDPVSDPGAIKKATVDIRGVNLNSFLEDGYRDRIRHGGDAQREYFTHNEPADALRQAFKRLERASDDVGLPFKLVCQMLDAAKVDIITSEYFKKLHAASERTVDAGPQIPSRTEIGAAFMKVAVPAPIGDVSVDTMSQVIQDVLIELNRPKPVDVKYSRAPEVDWAKVGMIDLSDAEGWKE